MAGCYAALVSRTAACITGNDPDKAAKLPDVTGLKSEVVLQQRQPYGYDRAYTVPGSKLVLVGDDEGSTADQLERAIGPDTAAVAFLVKADRDDSVVGLEDTVDIDPALGERSASELADDGVEVRLEVGDVAEPEVADAAARRAIATWGRIDVLVNNAGIGGINRNIWELPVEEMDRVYRTNLRGVYVFCGAIIPHMLERDYGRIVNIASVTGKEGNPRMVPYSAHQGGGHSAHQVGGQGAGRQPASASTA